MEFGVWNSGCRVLALRVWSLEFRVNGSGVSEAADGPQAPATEGLLLAFRGNKALEGLPALEIIPIVV